MEAAKSTFREQEVPCPACRVKSNQLRFKNRMFVKGETESDGHPLEYRWLDSTVQQVHPDFYFLHYCKNCNFADIVDDYESPVNNPNGKKVISAWQEAPQKIKLIAELISRHFEYSSEMDYRSALNLHFLGLLVQMSVPADERDHYKMGRLFLRIGWIYRDNTDSPSSNEAEPPGLARLRESEGQLLRALKTLQEQWENFMPYLKQRAKEVENQRPEEAANPYLQAGKQLEKGLDDFSGALYQLKTLRRKDGQGTLFSVSQGEGGGAFFTFPDFESYLKKLKSLWPTAPGDEVEALEAAIPCFEKSVGTDVRLDDSRKHFSMISLIADLMVRCGRLNDAYKMVRSIYKAGSDARVRYQKILQDKSKDEMEKRRAKGQLEQVKESLAQSGELRQRLLSQILERDMATIKKVISPMAGAGLEEIERALEQAGVMREIFPRLQEKGGPLEGYSKKKKGFFS